MPITIDTSKDAISIDEQMKQISQRAQNKKKVDAKFFSKTLTGSGNRKNGLFSKETDSINNFIKNSRRLLDTVDLNEAYEHNLQQFDNHSFGNQFKRETKKKEDYFLEFENAMTTIIPPIIVQRLIEDKDPISLTFPKQTGVFQLGMIESSWEVLKQWDLNGEPVTTYALPVLQSIRLFSKEETYTGPTGYTSKRNPVAGYPDIKILVATVSDNMDKNGQIIFANQRINQGLNVDDKQGVISIFDLNEQSHTQFNYNELSQDINYHINYIINTSNFIDTPTDYEINLIIGDQSISELLTSQATIITNQIEEIMLTFIRQFGINIQQIENDANNHPNNQSSDHIKSGLITYVQHIDVLNEMEDNLITTDLLAVIYESLVDNLNNKQLVNETARHSLRLLLSQRLHELDEINKSGGLYEFKADNTQARQNIASNPNYSIQQKKIISTTNPLTIGQAGAGSGKSHTVGGRIDYLRQNNEDLNKVLVLSFTNVSALNITQRYPGVRSETLANMFHTIYSASFPSQSLSQPSTVANSIRLLDPDSNYFKSQGLTDKDELRYFMDKFASNLEQFDQTGFKRVDLQFELKQMSHLIQSNLDLTLTILDAVEQTTLELEPIIIHHKLLMNSNSLNIPQEYQDLNYIITDESQDISTFEYILLLELTIHYRSQLLIIGDGSQTLYAFRNSDPRYMNALEASGVFKSHKLETNYRSNEEILMYANQFLQIIEANQHANIQLKSDNFTIPTVESVKDKIKVASVQADGRSTKDYTDRLYDFVHDDDEFKEWFLDKVRKGEQVAFMGWTRKEVIGVGEIIQEILNDNNLSNIEITNIMSESQRPMVVLSRFARHKNSTIRQLNPLNQNYVDEIRRHANDFVQNTFKYSSSAQKSFFEDTIVRGVRKITQTPRWNAMLKDLRNHNTNLNNIGGFLIRELLREETRSNAMNQFLKKQKEVPDYDNCPIILSTIHGTKGLEFDHSVVMFNEGKNSATSQESIRMMFVALSRAKKSEYLINVHPASKNRTVSNTHESMFSTPIESALMRTLDDAKVIEDNQSN